MRLRLIAVQRQEAFEDGVVIGEERGAHDARIETARSLLALGVNTHEQIAQATGLSLDEVMQLGKKS